MPKCEHYSDAEVTRVPTPVEGCEKCLESGDSWVHLRMCMACGHIGCCDSSKNRHARQHAEQLGHLVIRSAEEGETWSYCYEHDQYSRVE